MNTNPFKQIRDTYYSGRVEAEPHHLFNNVVLTPDARQTFMLCCGFIVGTHAAGNITLAEELADNLLYQMQFLAHVEHIREHGKKYARTYKEIGSDYAGMSFSFSLRREITEEETLAIKKMPDDVRPYIHEVTLFCNTQYYVTSLHGGIIFHGGRTLHHLEDMNYNQVHSRWWSTHT